MTEFKERMIKDISDEDRFVKIVGTVIEKDDSLYSVVLDDGSGKINVIFGDLEEFNKTDLGKLVRIFGEVVKIQDKFELKGILVQNAENLDRNFYKEAMKIIKLYG